MKTPAITSLDLRTPGALRKTLSGLAALFACAMLSHAAPLLQENFDSLTPGDLNGKNSWSADSGVDVVAGGLSYTSANGGAIKVNGGAQHAESANVSAVGPSPGFAVSPLATKSFSSQSSDVWMSFTMQISNSANSDRYWFWLSDTTNISTGFTASIGDTSNSSKNLNADTRINTSVVSSGGTAYTEGQTVFLIARLSKDGAAINTSAYDRVELWVNPTSTTLGLANVSVDRTNSSFTGGVVNFGLSALGATPTIKWDNLLVGTTQADVLDVYAIPEPSTYAAFGGIAALGFAALRRRRA